MRSLPLRTLVPSVVLGCGFLLSSCNGDNDSLPLVGSGPGSIQRLNAPASRSVSVVGQLNQYRAQAYSVLTATSKDVNHSNVLYTAAYRHSVWLNTVNSATYDPTTLTGIEGTTVTASSSTDQLRAEIAATTTTTSYFPALKTAKDPWNRVNAVVGGSDLLKQLVNKGIKEYFLFDGDIEIDTTTTGTGTGSSNTGEHLRGYSLGSTNLIDNLWYSRKGRLALVRPNLTAIGLAQVEDASPSGSPIIPPWPFLNGRFTGSVMCAYARPEQQQLTVWPKDGSTGIKTVGLDTDLLEVVNIGDSGLTEDEVVGHAYAGPPISVTLPVNVPFLLNSTINAGGVTVGFRKLEIDPETTLPQTPPAVVSPYVAVFFAVPTTGGTAEDVVFGAVNQATDARYQYTVVGTTVTTTATTTTGTAQDDAIHNGELIVVPTCPLESGSWYEVAVRLRTSSSAPWDEFPGTQEAGLEGTSSNNDGYYQFRFKTQ
jgi:hypothetical protein